MKKPLSDPEIVIPTHATSKKDMQDREKLAAQNRTDYIPLGDGIYQLPQIAILKYDDTSVKIDREAMREVSVRLVATLQTYGIRGEVTAIRPGPVVTMYEFAPAPGTRVGKIASLSDDLAMALEAVSVRIVAPIPGKAAVGIELPNKQREIVFLKEILTEDVFQKAKSKLTIALGKDSEGHPVAVDLSKMPHLLVAGTTGSGKSVGLNTMIASILFNASPEEVRLIMVDPKMLELSAYEGIPHLLLPVVTDPKQANLALRWAVEEMERRYQLLADVGVKDILSYNLKAAHTIADVADADEADLPFRRLPHIVIIIDEYADLMMQAAKEVEWSVTRLAQKARACGVHLILATQRPTTEIITGLIKSNFPSRIAFKVTSKINSIAILEQSGAEALLGHGDMLFSDRGAALRRIHGCLVQEGEIHALVDFLKKQAQPVYDLSILKPRDEDDTTANNTTEDDDEIDNEVYDRAVTFVAESRQASISLIQRRFRVGYNRAARIIERMEKDGVVGPQALGSGRREVLIEPV